MKKIIFTIVILLSGCASSKYIHQQITELNYPDDLPVVKRADWGWVPIDTTFKTQTIKYITIHHGGVIFKNDEDPVEDIRNLQSWSRKEKHWIDIPYHFMISPDGRIFETRPINIPGDTNTEYDPTGHALVEVMGNFEVQQFGPKQYESMIKLIKFLQKRFDVPVNRVKTHRDYSNMTVCPGKNVYKLFTDGTVEKALTK
jgi:hypothetical protein